MLGPASGKEQSSRGEVLIDVALPLTALPTGDGLTRRTPIKHAYWGHIYYIILCICLGGYERSLGVNNVDGSIRIMSDEHRAYSFSCETMKSYS